MQQNMTNTCNMRQARVLCPIYLLRHYLYLLIIIIMYLSTCQVKKKKRNFAIGNTIMMSRQNQWTVTRFWRGLIWWIIASSITIIKIIQNMPSREFKKSIFILWLSYRLVRYSLRHILWIFAAKSLAECTNTSALM